MPMGSVDCEVAAALTLITETIYLKITMKRTSGMVDAERITVST